MHNLTNVTIGKLAQGKKIADGGGLYLAKPKGGGASWTFRFVLFGKSREIGLGSYPALSIREARKKALQCREWVANGKDPKTQLVEKVEVAAIGAQTLAVVLPKAFDAIRRGLKADGDAGRWLSPVQKHIIPKLGRYPVSEITRAVVADAVRPIWHKKPVTARKAVTRLGKVLDWAEAAGAEIQEGATSMKKLRVILGESKPKNRPMPAMHFSEVANFYETIPESVGGLALKLHILIGGGVRSTPLVSIRHEWLKGDVLIFPAEILKGPKDADRADFRVPLSDEAMRVCEKAKALGGEFLFTGSKGKPITIAALSAILKRKQTPCTVHGFRSTFRDWAEDTGQDWAATETCLDHVVGGKTERAYRRNDLLAKRRGILAAWAGHVSGPVSSNIVPITKVAAHG